MSISIRALWQPRSKCCASAFFFLTSLVIHCCASGKYVAIREAVSVLKADRTASNVSFSYLTDSGPLGVTLSPSNTLMLTGPTTIAVLNNDPPGVTWRWKDSDYVCSSPTGIQLSATTSNGTKSVATSKMSGISVKVTGGTFILDSQKLYWFQPADIALRITHMTVNISGQSVELSDVEVRTPLMDMPGFPGKLTQTKSEIELNCATSFGVLLRDLLKSGAGSASGELARLAGTSRILVTIHVTASGLLPSVPITQALSPTPAVSNATTTHVVDG